MQNAIPDESNRDQVQLSDLQSRLFPFPDKRQRLSEDDCGGFLPGIFFWQIPCISLLGLGNRLRTSAPFASQRTADVVAFHAPSLVFPAEATLVGTRIDPFLLRKYLLSQRDSPSSTMPMRRSV
jgi:hypothetical protein